MFELTAHPIDPAALSARLARPDAGALVVFEGRVRNHHLGRPVTHLEYEAFDELARAEGDAIVAETERLHPGAHVLCVHRTGSLGIGDIAVWIGVASTHRHTGFAACRHVIEEIKRRLPIWKKEHHPDGAAEWVNCTAEPARTAATADDFHARQTALPEVGTTGQARLAAARVLVVGLGGLGCPAALYLAGAGIGRLTLVDGGKIERSNLHRQTLFTLAEIGAPKALAAAARLRLHTPTIEIAAHETDLDARNARALVAGHDVALDCTDNFAARFVLHDACHALGVPLVSAAVHRFEGTLDVFRHGEGGCVHCLWPARRADELEVAGNCAAGPVFAPAVGMLGTLQASETLKLLLGLDPEAARRTTLVNLLDNSFLTIARPARADCPACGTPEAAFAPVGRTDRDSDDAALLDHETFAALNPAPRVVRLAGPGETPGATDVVSPHDLARLRELAADRPLALTCHSGVRSAALARLLRAEGLRNVYALSRAGFSRP